MINLTQHEKHVLNAIAYHEFNPGNGARPESAKDVNTWCWADGFTGPDLDTQQVKGVLSSLVKKQLIAIEDYDERDNIVRFTDAGFEAFETVDRGGAS